MADDPRGYYRILGVAPTAPLDEITRAFRRLAKEWHPDKNKSATAAATFKQINEAYAVLRNSVRRTEYDALAIDIEIPKGLRPEISRIDAIRCSVCKRVTAQPRYLVFWNVASLLVASTRSPTQGIFCASCAGKVGLRCTFVTSAFGWWSVVGVFWTPVYGFRNVIGGQRPDGLESNLLWHNAVAFLTQEETSLSAALAQRVIQLGGAHADEARELIRRLKSRGLQRLPTLKDPWRLKPVSVAARSAILLAVPGILALVLAFSLAAQPLSARNYATSGAPPAIWSSTPVAEGPPCATPPTNGEVLSGSMYPSSNGHEIEIQNNSGSDAIVKVRNTSSGTVMVSFYVIKEATASISGIPDGSYRVQFAFGDRLARNCRDFAHLNGAEQFPDVENLATQYTQDSISTETLSYTLTAVPNGNVQPQDISPAAFNAP